MPKKLVNPERLYDGTPFGMSQAVLDTESSLVFVSGQVDWDRQYQVSQNSVSGQFAAALENLRTALVAAGASVDNLLHLLHQRPEIQFVFCGNGAGRADLMDRCAGLSNVRFLDLQPLERLSDWLGLADVHLLPQRADAADLVMPSKLTGMLASGRAVLATALPNTELCRVVTQDAACGLVVPPENPAAMADALRSLAADPAWRARLGANGRRHAEAENRPEFHDDNLRRMFGTGEAKGEARRRVDQLLQAGRRVRALTREPAKAALPGEVAGIPEGSFVALMSMGHTTDKPVLIGPAGTKTQGR